MKRLSVRIVIAALAFTVGISLATLWVVRSRQVALTSPPITPTPIPAPPPSTDASNRATLEMVFVLDTTGSMGGLLDAAKSRIWSVVNDVMQAKSRPNVRIGLVAYRDRSDDYVTEVLPLTEDLDRVYSTLTNYRAEGGGDSPEDVRRALADAVNKVGWSQAAPRLAQIIFLVGDAPPHDDYKDAPDTVTTATAAIQRNMIVNTIQCGAMPDTQAAWQRIARAGRGVYLQIAQNGGVETIATPYDGRISELGARLGGTFIAYGGGGGAAGAAYRAAKATAQSAMEANINSTSMMNANMAGAAADRAYNKVLNRQAYADDLLQAIENGTIKLEAIKDEDLPDSLQPLPADARRAEVERRLAKRQGLKAEIVELSKQRDAAQAAERKRRATGENNNEGFDKAVSTALNEQLRRQGIE